MPPSLGDREMEELRRKVRKLQVEQWRPEFSLMKNPISIFPLKGMVSVSVEINREICFVIHGFAITSGAVIEVVVFGDSNQINRKGGFRNSNRDVNFRNGSFNDSERNRGPVGQNSSISGSRGQDSNSRTFGSRQDFRNTNTNQFPRVRGSGVRPTNWPEGNRMSCDYCGSLQHWITNCWVLLCTLEGKVA
jgi:hypothetical protein